MREKSVHSPQRDSNLYLWDTRPPRLRLHHKSRHASRQSKKTLQTPTHQLHRETQACITKHSNSYLRDRNCHQASARTSAESEEACQRKTKDRADDMRDVGVRACVCVCVCVACFTRKENPELLKVLHGSSSMNAVLTSPVKAHFMSELDNKLYQCWQNGHRPFFSDRGHSRVHLFLVRREYCQKNCAFIKFSSTLVFPLFVRMIGGSWKPWKKRHSSFAKH